MKRKFLMEDFGFDDWHIIYQAIQDHLAENTKINLDTSDKGLTYQSHQVNKEIQLIKFNADNIPIWRRIDNYLKNIALLMSESKFPDDIYRSLINFHTKVETKLMFLSKINQPADSIVSILSPDIFINIANQLSIASLRKLLPTCGFFSNHGALREILNRKIINEWGIEAGRYHTFFLNQGETEKNGRLYGVGSNYHGQLGLDDIKATAHPKLISLPFKSKQVVAGYRHTLVISGPYLYGFGENDSSQLGLGEHNQQQNSVFSPQQIILSTENNEIPIQVATSSDFQKGFTIVVCDSKRVYVFGANDKGQLGLGDLRTRFTPTLNNFLSNLSITKLIIGGSHTFLMTDKGVYGFGDNCCGQLGFGKAIPFQSVPKRIPFEKLKIKPVQISAGGFHSLILDESGIVYGLGAAGCCCQLGRPDTADGFVPTPIILPFLATKVKARTATSYIWCGNQVYGLGDNIYGQLGIGMYRADSPNPELIQLSPTAGLLDVIPGGSHTFIRTNNQLYATGDNSYGQLAIKFTNLTQISSPMSTNVLKNLQNVIEEEEKQEFEKNKLALSTYRPL